MLKFSPPLVNASLFDVQYETYEISTIIFITFALLFIAGPHQICFVGTLNGFTMTVATQ